MYSSQTTIVSSATGELLHALSIYIEMREALEDSGVALEYAQLDPH